MRRHPCLALRRDFLLPDRNALLELVYDPAAGFKRGNATLRARRDEHDVFAAPDCADAVHDARIQQRVLFDRLAAQFRQFRKRHAAVGVEADFRYLAAFGEIARAAEERGDATDAFRACLQCPDFLVLGKIFLLDSNRVFHFKSACYFNLPRVHKNVPASRDTLLVELLAIRLGESTTLAKSLVMAKPAVCGSGCEVAITAPDASQRRVMATTLLQPPENLAMNATSLLSASGTDMSRTCSPLTAAKQTISNACGYCAASSSRTSCRRMPGRNATVAWLLPMRSATGPKNSTLIISLTFGFILNPQFNCRSAIYCATGISQSRNKLRSYRFT